MTTRSMHRYGFGLAALAVFAAQAAAGDPRDDRALLDRAAAERPTRPAAAAPPAVPARTDELAAAEQEARIELAVAEVRLETVMARKAVQAQKFEEAATRANRVLELVASLPTVDVSVFELQAEGILAKAARAGINVNATRTVTLGMQPQQPVAAPPAAPLDAAPPAAEDDGRYRGAARISRAYDGADTPDVDTTGDGDALRERAIANQNPDSRGFRPGIEVIDGRGIEARDEQRVQYEGQLNTAYSADEAARLTNADEARVAGDQVITYPDNWPAQKARRAQYANGVVARSAPWTGSDGKQWHAAIYDITDLTYVPPDFQNHEGLTPSEAYWRAMSLDSLLYGSEIFSGYPEDLAAGLPLLRMFGAPLDDFEFRGPKYSAERAEQIAEMIRALTTQSAEAKVEVIGP